MAGALTTIPQLDADVTRRNQAVWDQNGDGTVYVPVTILGDATGSPIGPATASGQTTGNATLASLLAELTALVAQLPAALTGGGNLKVSLQEQASAISVGTSATGGIPSTARLASSAASTNATNVKTSAGRIYSMQGRNNAAYDVFLVLYDAATNPPVPGTTTIRKKICIPASSAFALDWPLGLSFANGIGYAFTKLVADSDTTAIAAADVTAFNMDYN